MPTFPSLPGLGWSVMKTPTFKTRKQQSIVGRTSVLVDQPNPIWKFTLTYEFLRDKNDIRPAFGGLGSGLDELRTLCGFYLQMQGSFNTFNFDDPTDNSILAQGLGTGNGSTTAFQLIRNFGGFNEPIINPNVVAHVYKNGVDSGGWSVGANGVINFGVAPAGGVVVTADFTYYFLCRFSEDTLEFENFFIQLWKAKTVKFESVVL